MTNKALARTLQHAADLVELTGGNAFRARAFASAARTIDRLDEPAADLMARGELTGLKGIGKGLSADLEQLLRTGSFEALDRLTAALPPGLLDVLQVKGLGVKKVRALWQQLGVTSLDDLERVAATGQMAELDGFGAKTQEKTLENLRLLRLYRARRRYATATTAVAPLLEALRADAGIRRADVAGELRRRCTTVGEAVLVVDGDADALAGLLRRHAEPATLSDDRPVQQPSQQLFFLGELPGGLTLRVYRPAPEDYAVMLWRKTGSQEHVAHFEAAHGTPPPAADEEAVYAREGMQPVPPELREGDGELDAARHGRLPELVTLDDLRGTIHNHSTYSDGAHTLRQMADAARRMGYAYFGVSDHSRSLAIAKGLSVERLREQGEEVRALNAAYAADGGAPFRVFHGSEVDILADGSLDYPDDVLAELDFVVASVHTHFGMSEAEATERLVTAVSHPATCVLGHPTGRLLLQREGYPIDHRAVLEACAAHGVAVELNANPYRLDVDWTWLRLAAELGVLVSINPDAHSVDGLADMRWGVAAARKGWLTARGCLNARTTDGFAAWLAERKGRGA